MARPPLFIVFALLLSLSPFLVVTRIQVLIVGKQGLHTPPRYDVRFHFHLENTPDQ